MARRSSERGASTASPVASELPPELVADLKRMGEMLASGDVEGARTWVKELETRWPESERVRHYAYVLAPPTVRVVPRTLGRSLRREQEWLQEHAREYPGRWLAVFEDRLIASDPSLAVVLKTVSETPGVETSLIHFQPGTDTCP